jgi:hypothetical protein
LSVGATWVLTAHHTPVGSTLVTANRGDGPVQLADDGRLPASRGSVRHIVERFTRHEYDGATGLEYRGPLGTDFWSAGRWWGDGIAGTWEATVRSSLERIRVEAERQAARADDRTGSLQRHRLKGRPVASAAERVDAWFKWQAAFVNGFTGYLVRQGRHPDRGRPR